MISDALSSLGGSTGASRTYLCQIEDVNGLHYVDLRYSWNAPGIRPLNAKGFHEIPFLDSEPCCSRIRKGQAFAASLNKPVSILTRFLATQSVVSVLLIPVMMEERCWGFVGFDDCVRERIWSDAQIQSLRDTIDNVTAAVLRERAERSIREATTRLEVLVSNLQAGVMVEDPEGKITLVNQTFCNLVRLRDKPDALVGRLSSEEHERIAPLFVDPAAAIRRIRHILQNRQIVIEEEVRFSDGRIIERDFIPIRRGEEYLGHFWEYRDVTDRKLAQERLTRIARLQEIVGNVIATFMEDDHAGAIDRILREVGYFLGVSRAYVFHYQGSDRQVKVANEWSAVETGQQRNLLEEIRAISYEPWQQRLEAGGIINCADVELDPDVPEAFREACERRGTRAALILPVVILGRAEGFIGVDDIRGARLWVDEDLTLLQTIMLSFARAIERRIAEAERSAAAERLREALEKAENANRYKSEFLASMSHEIRTPMTAIVGYADLVLRPRQRLEDYQQWGRQIRKNADFLLGLINDILDLSKIEAGQFSVRPEACNPVEIVESVQDFLRPIAREKVLEFNTVFETPMPRQIQTDPLRFRQILVNLANNAIKFTDKGAVTIRVRFGRIPDGKGLLTIGVEDTGIGISADKLNRLFSVFSQVHTNDFKRYGGTGLGLAISRRLARMLGGDIAVESTPGVGSRFTLSLEMSGHSSDDLVTTDTQTQTSTGTTQPLEHEDDRIRLDGAHVLIVDDNPDNQRIIQFLVEEVGAATTIVDNGVSAMNAVIDSISANKPFDVVLMDMQMPVMDGYTATRNLRSRGIKIPIIALTAFAMSTDQDRCLAAGCDSYLTKPIVPDALLGMIRKHLTPAVLDRERKLPAIVSTLANQTKFIPLLKAYVRSLPDSVRLINDAWNKSDREALKAIVHKLKGSGGSYGFPIITEICESCETHLRSNQPLDGVKPELLRLVQTLDAAAASFSQDPPEQVEAPKV